jgi:hypothetical protein
MANDLTSEIKNALFASGMPLEYSAETVLRRCNFRTVSGDFSFVRAGAQGEMSIDLAAERRVFSESLEGQFEAKLKVLKVIGDWRILVECKFRTENVRWLFAPYEGPLTKVEEYHSGGLEHRGHIVFGAVFAETDAPVRFVRLSQPSGAQAQNPWPAIVPAVSLRGIESRPVNADSVGGASRHEAYSSEIRKAARQLQFAVMPYMWPTVREWVTRARAESYQREPPRPVGFSATFFSPYLVTTAELYVLKPSATIETIRAARSIDEIASPVDALEFATSPSMELLEHHRALLHEFRQWPQSDLTQASERAFFDAWEPVAYKLEQLSPSITVVRYSQLERCLNAHAEALNRFMAESGSSWGSGRGYSWG